MIDDQKPEPIRYYGKFDREGVPQGFWASDLFPAPEGRTRSALIPADAVELAKDQWRELISNQPRSRFLKGRVSVLPQPKPPPPPPNPLDELRDMLADITRRLEVLERR